MIESGSGEISIIERSIDRQISISVEFAQERSLIQGDNSQLQNAILNICLNARDAMPNGGQLSIKTRQQFLDKTFCKVSPFELTSGHYLQLIIEDTGIGIEPNLKQKVFEPFLYCEKVMAILLKSESVQFGGFSKRLP